MNIPNKINSSFPFVGRAVLRGVVSSLNFQVLTLAQQMVRQQQQEANLSADSLLSGGIDNYNEAAAAAEERAESERMRAEQGHEVRMPALELGALLLTLSNNFREELLSHAGMIESMLRPGTMLPNPYDLGESVEETLTRQMARAPRMSSAQAKAEMKAYGFSEEKLAEAFKKQHESQLNFLKENKELILSHVERMRTLAGVTDNDAEAAWDKLPTIQKLRLLAAADNGLYYAAQRELTNFLVYNRPNGKSNAGLLVSERRVIHAEINDIMKNPTTKREIDAEIERGASLPNLQPLPEIEVKQAA
jgi:hypothetical protein